MVSIASLLEDLDGLLEPARFADYGPNGLQVPGRTTVDRVATGVSAQLELFERAAAARAQVVLVHHGLLWDFHPTELPGRQHARLKALYAHELNLVAYHLPLDAHPEVGNNALLAAALGADRHTAFGEHRGQRIGRLAEWDAPLPVETLLERMKDAGGGREPLLQGAGPPEVRRVAIASGSAADLLDEAVAAGADALLTGEPREHVMADAREAGIHFVAAGHYATETLGVRALGDRLAERFGIEHVWLDIPNPV